MITSFRLTLLLASIPVSMGATSLIELVGAQSSSSAALKAAASFHEFLERGLVSHRLGREIDDGHRQRACEPGEVWRRA